MPLSACRFFNLCKSNFFKTSCWSFRYLLALLYPILSRSYCLLHILESFLYSIVVVYNNHKIAWILQLHYLLMSHFLIRLLAGSIMIHFWIYALNNFLDCLLINYICFNSNQNLHFKLLIKLNLKCSSFVYFSV